MSEPFDTLFAAALAARDRAYVPYSGFKVGAAAIDQDGRVFAGCNVENAAYPQGQCAEATTIGMMVAGGGSRIAELVVIGGEPGPRIRRAGHADPHLRAGRAAPYRDAGRPAALVVRPGQSGEDRMSDLS